MNATDGYPGTNINPEGHTPMSTTATTTRRTLYVGNLALDDTTPCLMPGDVIHIEATLTVRSVENGLDHFDRPAETITTRSDVKDGPQVAVRTSTLKAADGNPLTTPPAEQGNPTIRERINQWRAKHRTTLGAAAVTGWAFVWVASIALLMVSLTGCGTSTSSTPTPSPAPAAAPATCDGCLPNHRWAASGEECTRIGAKAIGRKGGTLLCKPAPASNIAVGDNAPRWRKA